MTASMESALGDAAPSTERGRRRREQILDAATELFRRQGFPGTGIDEIGEAAGITGPGIYRHFSSKDEILLSILDRIWDLLRPVTEEVGDQPPGQRLDRLIAAHTTLALDHRAELLILLRELRHVPEDYRRAAQRNDARYMDVWAEAISDLYPGCDRAEARVAARAVTGLIASSAGEPRSRRIPKDRYRAILGAMAWAALQGLDDDAIQRR